LKKVGNLNQNVYQVILFTVVDMFMKVNVPRSNVTECNFSEISHPAYPLSNMTDFTHSGFK